MHKDNQMEINEKFSKLEGWKYGKDSMEDSQRLNDFWNNLDDEEYEDWESLYEYIEDKY